MESRRFDGLVQSVDGSSVFAWAGGTDEVGSGRYNWPG